MKSNEQSSILRFGYVVSYDPSRHMARINFPDSGLVSDWLPIAAPNTRINFDEAPLSVNEHVACVMRGNGIESGIIIGAFYDKKNTPPVHDENTRSITFSDGGFARYNTSENKLEIHSEGDMIITINDKINITGGSTINISSGSSVSISSGSNITLSAPSINLDALTVECPNH